MTAARDDYLAAMERAAQVVRCVARAYCGGIQGFIADGGY